MGKGAAGILLTGGSSSRMGVDKATLRVDGVGMAQRLGSLLADRTDPAIEIGPGRSSLPSVQEPDPGQGPLVAIATAAQELLRREWRGPAVVLACDLPLLSGAAMELLIEWPGEGAAVPVVEGRRQTLCARWSALDLEAAVGRVAAGHRSLGGLPQAGPDTELTEAQWSSVTDGSVFADVDAPWDLERLGWHRVDEASGLGRVPAAGGPS